MSAVQEATEEWRVIPGFPDYMASSSGAVTNLNGTPVKVVGTTYREASLVGEDGHSRMVKIHRAVAWAFLGPQLKRMHVAHNNGDRYDNRIDNLRYATPKENAEDTVTHWGSRLSIVTRPKSKPGPKTGITEDQKVEMHRLHREGNLTVQSIALRFDISTTTLYKYIEEVEEARKNEELK